MGLGKAFAADDYTFESMAMKEVFVNTLFTGALRCGT
jgi:hypothetical protein